MSKKVTVVMRATQSVDYEIELKMHEDKWKQLRQELDLVKNDQELNGFMAFFDVTDICGSDHPCRFEAYVKDGEKAVDHYSY